MTPSPAGAVRPEHLDQFRQGRLLLLMDVLARHTPALQPDIERLGIYDFFAANPFLVPLPPTAQSQLAVAGFTKSNLSYQSASQRFANARARIQFDLAVLASRGLAFAQAMQRRVTYRLTPTGQALAPQMRSMYAQSYQASAVVVVGHLRRMSDTALRDGIRQWLRAEAFLIDLYEPEAVSSE
jgi:predicted transcriptional regulator